MKKPISLFIHIALIIFVIIQINIANANIFNPKTTTLENGLKVVVVENHRAPVVTHMLWYRVGAMDEPAGKSGIAHFFEHLMFKGTKKIKDGEFSSIVARNGGQENAFTSQDYTAYYQSVAAGRLGLMMEIEADRMRNLSLTKAAIEPERQVVLEERRSRIENSPSGILSEHATNALYMNHPYAIPIIGWAHEVENLSLKDLNEFYQTYYAPNNAILLVVGDVKADKVFKLAEHHYGKILPSKLPDRPNWQEPPHLDIRDITYHDKKVKAPVWIERRLAPSYFYGQSEDIYALQIFSDIIGGGASSRLYRSIVIEQKIATSVGSWYDPTKRGPSSFGIYGVAKDGKSLDMVKAAVNAEIQKIIDDGVNPEEVKASIIRMQDSAVLALDSLSTPAHILGQALAIGLEINDVEDWPERIGKIDVAAVNAAAKRLFMKEAVVNSYLLGIDQKAVKNNDQ